MAATRLILLCALIVPIGCPTHQPEEMSISPVPLVPNGSWVYRGELHKAIKRADRVVVRDGGADCCEPVLNDKVIFSVTDPGELASLFRNLAFQKYQDGGLCLCCGCPGIDWYEGEDRLALTSLKHGRSIKWKGLPSQAVLTPESKAWLKEWMLRHGVTNEKMR